MSGAAKAAGGAGESGGKREELDEIELVFTDVNITVKLDFDATWEEAQEAIAKAIGRVVFFSWVDGDETVVVDTPEEFEDLFAELEDDWDDERGSELNGRMEVKIVEKEAASGQVTGQQRKLAGSASKTPSGVGDEKRSTQAQCLSKPCPPRVCDVVMRQAEAAEGLASSAVASCPCLYQRHLSCSALVVSCRHHL